MNTSVAENKKDSVLRLENITMQFGGVVAVNDLSLEVNRGEIVSLIGPNGAGKTTVFNVVTGVYEPTNGAVYYNDNLLLSNKPQGKMKNMYAGTNDGKFQTVMSKTPDQITKLGVARTFQNIRLFKTMTVFENVLVAKHMRKRSNLFTSTFRINRSEEQRMRKESLELLELLGLSDVKDELATSLPYGKQRYLEIARALATDPQLLLLDEPAAGMNPQETMELTEFINDIRKKFDLTILMIEHHMNLVMDISDRIYVIDFGKLISSGVPEVVQNDEVVINAYLGVADDE